MTVEMTFASVLRLILMRMGLVPAIVRPQACNIGEVQVHRHKVAGQQPKSAIRPPTCLRGHHVSAGVLSSVSCTIFSSAAREYGFMTIGSPPCSRSDSASAAPVT